MFRIVLLGQMCTNSNVKNIYLYVLLRGSRVAVCPRAQSQLVNWQPFPAAVIGASLAYCLSRALKLVSFVPKNCALPPYLPGSRQTSTQEVRFGRCQDHEQLWRSTEGTREGQA